MVRLLQAVESTLDVANVLTARKMPAPVMFIAFGKRRLFDELLLGD